MIFEPRRWLALTVKEFQQIRKNKQLLFQLVFPPLIGLTVFGFVLNPEVKHLRMGVVDESQSRESRELVRTLTANEAFTVTRNYVSPAQAGFDIQHQELDLAIVIPSDFAVTRARQEPAEVQVLIDAVNANTASIAQAYLSLAVSANVAAAARRVNATSVVLFNPGILHAWYFVTGTLSILVFINSALTAAAITVREKEIGTIEQLLMSPGQTAEILLAKTAPVLCMAMVVLTVGMAVSILVFGVPVRGSVPLLILSAALSAIAGIGLGITVATFASSQQQAQILTFFLMPPQVLISGAFAPVESMPMVLQYAAVIDPLRYMVRMMRGVTIKGVDLGILWPQLAALAAFAAVLYGVSALRFRRQLGG